MQHHKLTKMSGWLVAPLVLLVWTLMVGTAGADGPEGQILLAVTENAAVGERAELVARVVGSEGEPLEDVKVTFVAEMEFLNVYDRVTIGKAVTDSSGVARVFYLPRTDGEITVTARAGDAEIGGPQETSAVLTVEPGPPVYSVDKPIRIPGANVWLVVVVLTVVWSLYLWMMWLLQKISSDKGAELTLEESTGE